MNQNEDKVALESGDKPDVQGLVEEFRRSTSQAVWGDRRTAAENTRFAWWEGQDLSGKKLDEKQPDGQPAFPWDGASDERIYMADEIVNWNVDVLENAFAAAVFTADGITASNSASAGYVSRRLDWAKSSGIPQLEDEVEYAAQYGQTYGWCVVQALWDRKIGKRYQDVTLEEVAALARMLPAEDVRGQLASLIVDPEMEEAAAELLRGMYADYVKGSVKGVYDAEVPELSLAEARRMVRELRNEEKTRVALPVITQNSPRVVALKPWEEVFFPPETMDLQRARAIFRVDFLSEKELRAKVAEEGWDKDFVDEVIAKTKGKESASTILRGRSLSPDQSNILASPNVVQSREKLHEIVYGYVKKTDEAGVGSVWYTVFSPHLGTESRGADGGLVKGSAGRYGLHVMVDYTHGEYPFVAVRRERPTRRIYDARGVPEVCLTWQRSKKVQRDAITDRTSITVVPPLLVPTRSLGKVYRLMPAGQIGRDRQGDVEWMHPPAGGLTESAEITQQIQADADNYFGQLGLDVNPVKCQVKQQAMVNRFLGQWVQVFRQVDALMTQFLSAEELARISGQPEAEQGDWDRAWRQDWKLKFDVRNLNMDFMVAKFKAFVDFAVASDVGGVIDRAKLTALMAAAIDPTIARAVITDGATASQQLFKGVRDDFAQMALGNEAEYTENDPTAERKLQFAQQVVGTNPKYQQLMMQDERFKELVQKWTQNLQQSLLQTQNKQIGRIGVRPMG